MRKANRILIFLLGVMLFMTLAMGQSAYAVSINVGDIIKFADGPGNTNGGEFIISSVNGKFDPFTSFCIETNEYINFTSNFIVDSISTNAVNGGKGGGSPDPLDSRTAYLYYMFATNQLSGYDYNNSTQRVLDANSLQLAFWFLENEITSISDAQSLAWIAEAEEAIRLGKWLGLGDVRVLNIIWADTGEPAQSQLVLVPEPTTLLLLGSGLVGLALFRRYRRRAN